MTGILGGQGSQLGVFVLGAGDTATATPRQVFLLGSRDTAPQLVGRSHATVVVVGRT